MFGLPTKDPLSAILSMVAVVVSLLTFAMNYAYTRRNAIRRISGRIGWIPVNGLDQRIF